mmetsp:Transcript_22297/g.68626  ORF Transcript_22297/g.68626 Transcript_22297/m.68626 type:complete len:221 (+) Transcript_22297:133-795(+)
MREREEEKKKGRKREDLGRRRRRRGGARRRRSARCDEEDAPKPRKKRRSLGVVGFGFEGGAAGGAAFGDGGAARIFFFLDALGLEAMVLGGFRLGLLDGAQLDDLEVALALAHDGRDEALDLRFLGDGLALLVLELALEDVLLDVVFLGQRKQFADLGGAFRAEADGHLRIRQAFDRAFALLHDHQIQNGQVVADDASANGLSLALARLALPVARVALTQ